MNNKIERLYIYENKNMVCADIVTNNVEKIITIKGKKRIFEHLKANQRHFSFYAVMENGKKNYAILQKDTENKKNSNERVYIIGENSDVIINSSVVENKENEKFVIGVSNFCKNRADLIITTNDYNIKRKKSKKNCDAYMVAKFNNRIKKLKKTAALSISTIVLLNSNFIGNLKTNDNDGNYAYSYEDQIDTKINSITYDYEKESLIDLDTSDIQSYIYEQELEDAMNQKEELNEYINDSIEFEYLNNETEEYIDNEVAENENSVYSEDFSLEEIIGSNLNATDISRVNSFLESEDGYNIIFESEKYGIDPYLMVAIALNESSLNHYDCLPGAENFNGSAYGLMQIENPSGNAISAENVITGDIDVIRVTEENASNIQTNVQIAAMMIQELSNKYNNNYILITQAYNYGDGAIDLVIDKLAEQKGLTQDEIINSYDYEMFAAEFELIHSDPINYPSTCSISVQEENSAAVSYLKNWDYSTYGDEEYSYKAVCNYMGETFNIYLEMPSYTRS